MTHLKLVAGASTIGQRSLLMCSRYLVFNTFETKRSERELVPTHVAEERSPRFTKAKSIYKGKESALGIIRGRYSSC